MVKRKKTSAVEEHENGMTVGLRDGIGVDGPNNWARKLEGCDEEESGYQGSEERSTKRDGVEIHTLSTTGCSSSAPVITTSVSNPSGPCSSQQPRSSTAPSHDQHHFLRSSVRPPSKRIRKDSIAPNINGPNGAKSKGSENGVSHQVSASQSGSTSGSTGPSGKAAPRGQGPGDKEEPVGSQKRPRRQWESWSAEDKNSFFEGLYEHGKDFEAIQTNIVLKHKKKGKPASMVKNKEQVRHFYYRTWHKISKHIDFANVYSRVLKKSSQELYGLICYAELRKKVGGLMDDKNVAKLNELIQQGATTVRSKGRNLRIKAPMCRALKRLCDPDGVSDEEDQKPVRLPLKVAVELQPRSNHSWARVQSLAHNPRLRMVVELHRKVSSLIEFLKQKWDVQDQLILKSLQEREALEGTQQHSGSGSPALPCRADEDLFLYPAETSTLTALPSVARVVHSKASCTVHWQESGKPRPGPKELIPTAQILGIQGSPLLPRGGVAKPGRGGGGGDARRVGGETPVSTAEGGTLGGGAGPEHKNLNQITSPPVRPLPSPSSLLLLSMAQKQEGGAATGQVEGEKGLGGGPGVGKALGAKEGDGDSNSQGQGGGSCSATEPCRHEERTPGVNGSDSASPERNFLPLLDPLVPTTPPPATVPRQVEDVPPDQGQGWTAAPGKEECGGGGSTPTPVSGGRSAQRICDEGWSSRGSDSNVTLAELYLMLGKPGKLQLVYEWQPASVAAPELGEEGLQGPGQTCPQQQSPRPLPPPSTHRVLRCLLRLVSSEVNPKPAPDLCSTATSPVKPSQEEQSLTPPGKAPAVGVRSPNCGRLPPLGVRAAKLMLPNTGLSGRNLPRSLLVSGGDSDGGVFAVPTTLPPNSSRHSRMFSPNKEAELAFRQQLDSISLQSDIFLPKQRKNRSRPLRKPLVVQRTLLPRTTGDTPQHVCSFSILSNSSATGTGSFRPIQPRLSPSTRPPLPRTPPITSGPRMSSQLSSAIDLAAKSAGIIPGSPCRELKAPSPDGRPLSTSHPGVVHASPPQPQLLQQASSEVSLQNGLPPPSPGVAGDSLLSPPSVASLLDISLPGPLEEAMAPGGPQTHISDSIIELAINSAHYGDEASLSPAKLNGSECSKLLPCTSVSPSRGWIPSPSHDPQWYPNDSTDSSFGCLLSSLVSPDKGRRSSLTPSGPSSGTALLGPRFLDCNSHDSFQSRGLPDVAEVDTQLACMMSESSVDYIARFNDLAQELAVTEPHLLPP
ncbi:protein cramped-like isoform X1 [Salmo salar]|uniref:Protein cramped-like n=2 Tax=Salmo salar TaxID=8030 RepID=A0A1S3P902_SALSA|nr:protein cramped-like isoform X1 [Salmo salar]|eukprot:XP_014024074.1 PREDICTED: protein cramped-like isoform X1 [Salmo salar]